MKKILTAFVLCILLFMSTACSSQREDFKDRFFSIRVDWNTIIYVDNATKVMYLWIDDYFGYGSGLSVMLDEKGEPLLWTEKK